MCRCLYSLWAVSALGHVQRNTLALFVSLMLVPDGCCAPERAEHIGAGHAFQEVGLANCQLNTSLPAGTTLEVPFSVIYPGKPDLNATVNRTILIVCPQGVRQQACHLHSNAQYQADPSKQVRRLRLFMACHRWLRGQPMSHAGTLLSLCVLCRPDIQLQRHLPGSALLCSRPPPTCSPAGGAVHS